MKFLLPLIAAALLAPSLTSAAELPIRIVAAQSCYGDVAAAIGGDRVTVVSVPTSPDADPHNFEPAPSMARSIADASIVIFNGAGYDHWMEKLLDATQAETRVVIEVAELTGVSEGANPHLWYDPQTMPAVADAIAVTLATLDPDAAETYATRREAFVASLVPVDGKIAAIKAHFKGTPITATEPVFGPMADALGLVMTNKKLQTAIMNETEPSARDIAAVIDDIETGKVNVLIYNTQVADAMTAQFLEAAERANLPVVGVSETMPEGVGYADWMLGQLDRLEKALAGPFS